MSQEQLRVTFQPHGRAVFVLPGTKVLEAAARAGLTIETPCGGNGTCGKCRIQITEGDCEPTEADRSAFSRDELTAGWRLGCQTAICKQTVIRVPDSSRLGGGHRILTEVRAGQAEVRPAVRKVHVTLPRPTLADSGADLIRLERQTGAVKTDLELLRELSRLLRENGFQGTAVLADEHLIDFEPGETTGHCYGAAFDIGTTTLVGSLMDLPSGEELALCSRMNPQVQFGDDVLSRIKYTQAAADGLGELHEAIRKAVADMIAELCAEAGVRGEHVYELAFSGNTTMQHLLCRIPVVQLGQVPFVPAYARGLAMEAGHLHLPVHRRAAAYVFPVIGGFVGGDAVAGLLAARLAEQDEPGMMVDIGTNGEIVLCHEGRILAASTAAGPAFEGARISCGMRATAGAIEKIVLDGDLRYSVIGNVAPMGICGSALVDLAAELLTCGVVSAKGRLLGPEDLPADLPGPLQRRVSRQADGQTEFLIAERGAGRRDGRVVLTQRDIRELQLATGAIRAGIAILLRQAGLAPDQLKRVLIAGGFGSFIRRSKAQRIGLLPAEIDHARIQYIGNASLAGAQWALLSTDARQRAEQLARQAEHVQLSRDVDFQDRFAEAMIFPAG